MSKTAQMVATIGDSKVTHEIRGEFRYDRNTNRTMCGLTGSMGVASWQSGKEIDVTCKRCEQAGPKWIAYLHVNGPSHQFSVVSVESITEAVDTLREWQQRMCAGEVSASLYPYSLDDWESAMDYEDTGCPFDYPSKVIEQGPRGGFRVVNA